MKHFSYSIGAIASLSIGLFSTFACSTDDGEEEYYSYGTGGTTALGSGGTLGSGGSATSRGGATTGRGGASNVGGSNAGGTNGATGGATAGGSGGASVGGAPANGGASVGGAPANGGASVGGAPANGGASVGGSATAGGPSVGGGAGESSVGGAATAGAPANGGAAGSVNGIGGIAGAPEATGGTASAGAPTSGGTSSAGAATTGGTESTGGTSTGGVGTGGAATGGAATGGAATGGVGTGGAATGGAATGGVGTGGAATGGAATGGAAPTGGTGGVATCTATTVTKASYCRPETDGITGLSGSATINGVTFAATGSAIAITSATPITSGTLLTGLSPYNAGTCAGMGVNATSVATNQPYTGMSLVISNSSTAPVTISIYIDSIASGGQFVQRKYTFPEIPADSTARTYNLTWASAYTDSCTLPTGSNFDQTHITGIGFGVAATSTAVQLNLNMSSIAFTGGGATTPCSGICSSPTVLTGPFSRNNLGTGALCFETTSNFTQGNCGGFTSPRALSINGTAVNCNAGNYNAPAKVNGGYCFSAPAGNESWAYFGIW